MSGKSKKSRPRKRPLPPPEQSQAGGVPHPFDNTHPLPTPSNPPTPPTKPKWEKTGENGSEIKKNPAQPRKNCEIPLAPPPPRPECQPAQTIPQFRHPPYRNKYYNSAPSLVSLALE